MPTVSIKLKNRDFTLECLEAEREKVEESAHNLVALVNKLEASAPVANLEHLLVLAAVLLQNNAAGAEKSEGQKAAEEELAVKLASVKELCDVVLGRFRDLHVG